jgi:hypothetical protein
MPNRFCAAVPLNLWIVSSIDGFSQAAVFRSSKGDIAKPIKVEKNYRIPIPITAFCINHT